MIKSHSTPKYVEHLTVTSDLVNAQTVQTWFESLFHRSVPQLAWLDEQVMPLNLALTEGFTNTVRHAHAQLPVETPIEIDVTICSDRIEIRIWDYGGPFEIGEIRPPEPESLPEGGYGWSLLKKLTDQLTYERFKDRNCLLLIKQKPEDSDG